MVNALNPAPVSASWVDDSLDKINTDIKTLLSETN
jgi:hypothetical protein